MPLMANSLTVYILKPLSLYQINHSIINNDHIVTIGDTVYANYTGIF